MTISELHRLKALEAQIPLLEARIEKLEAYIWGEELNDETNDLDHGAVPHRKRGRPKKNAEATQA